MRWTDLLLWLRDYFGVPMMIAFVLIVATAYQPRNRDRLQAHAAIPLRDDP